MKPEDAKVFVESRMETAEVHSVFAGTAVVYSAPSPLKREAAEPNEDSAALIPFTSKSGLLVVADGAGGQRGATQASSTAVYEMCAALEQAAETGEVLREAVLNGMEHANKEICTLAIGAATTIAVVEIRGNKLRAYHVGDSEILVVGQKGKVKLQTVSHSPTSYAVESGFMDEHEAQVHEDRHLVSNVLGSPEMRIEMATEIDLNPRDSVLVACDGLFDNLATHEIVEKLRAGSLPEAVEDLVSSTHARMAKEVPGRPSKPDDLTLIAFRLADAEKEPE